MPDYAVSDSVSKPKVSDCVNFGEPRSVTTSLESGYVTAISDFTGDVNCFLTVHAVLRCPMNLTCVDVFSMTESLRW